jgi:hypothetical protein
MGTSSKGRLKGEVFPNAQAQYHETCNKEYRVNASDILCPGTT